MRLSSCERGEPCGGVHVCEPQLRAPKNEPGRDKCALWPSPARWASPKSVSTKPRPASPAPPSAPRTMMLSALMSRCTTRWRWQCSAAEMTSTASPATAEHRRMPKPRDESWRNATATVCRGQDARRSWPAEIRMHPRPGDIWAAQNGPRARLYSARFYKDRSHSTRFYSGLESLRFPNRVWAVVGTTFSRRGADGLVRDLYFPQQRFHHARF